MSGQFHHILPTSAQAVCRHIDRVIVGGSHGSHHGSSYIDLFCADVVGSDAGEAGRSRADSFSTKTSSANAVEGVATTRDAKHARGHGAGE